jgi:hypothetical protein
MTLSRRLTGLVLMSAVMGAMTSARAQEGLWEYKASFYLFAARTKTSTGTPLGPVSAELSFSDALENLDLAFMGTLEASNQKWSFIGDYMFTDLSFQESSPGPAMARANASVETQVFSGYALYRVHETAAASLDLGGGLRWFSTDTDIRLVGGAGNGLSFGADDSWFDPIIAARLNVALTDRWSGAALVDYGGFESGDDTWQVIVTFSYAINEKWLLRGGYRHIEVDGDVNGADFSFEQSGPVFGATYRF